MWKFLEKWFGPRKKEEEKTELVFPIPEKETVTPVFEIKEKPVVKVENRILYNLETEKAVREGDIVSDKNGDDVIIIGLSKSKLGIKVVCSDKTEKHLFNFPTLKAVEVNEE